eukprot:TRINITY_DN21_c2_g3_i2.p1 TRINITY_DN21_c2_g3~~TRINITY_DN21_c2_g3_i2.p1  ORF type:complete len:561 (-),score=77.14 TRINITY_DN21_c2_g3_i2:628-2310(-)
MTQQASPHPPRDPKVPSTQTNQQADQPSPKPEVQASSKPPTSWSDRPDGSSQAVEGSDGSRARSQPGPQGSAPCPPPQQLMQNQQPIHHTIPPSSNGQQQQQQQQQMYMPPGYHMGVPPGMQLQGRPYIQQQQYPSHVPQQQQHQQHPGQQQQMYNPPMYQGNYMPYVPPMHQHQQHQQQHQPQQPQQMSYANQVCTGTQATGTQVDHSNQPKRRASTRRDASIQAGNGDGSDVGGSVTGSSGGRSSERTGSLGNSRPGRDGANSEQNLDGTGQVVSTSEGSTSMSAHGTSSSGGSSPEMGQRKKSRKREAGSDGYTDGANSLLIFSQGLHATSRPVRTVDVAITASLDGAVPLRSSDGNTTQGNNNRSKGRTSNSNGAASRSGTGAKTSGNPAASAPAQGKKRKRGKKTQRQTSNNKNDASKNATHPRNGSSVTGTSTTGESQGVSSTSRSVTSGSTFANSKSACDHCRKTHGRAGRCDRGDPCCHCKKRGIECKYTEQRRRGPKPGAALQRLSKDGKGKRKGKVAKSAEDVTAPQPPLRAPAVAASPVGTGAGTANRS